MIIAVPSFKRPLIFKKNTYQLINDLPFDKYLFLESEEAQSLYETEIDLSKFKIVITDTTGIAEKRNFMKTFFYNFKKDLKILYLDDDLLRFEIKEDNKTKPIDLIHFCYEGFSFCAKYNLNIWGINTLTNGLFLKDTQTTNLRYIQGGFMGEVINSCWETYPYTEIDHYEDYDFTLQYYLRDGGVVRMNNICLITKPWNDGGINESLGGLEKRKETMKPNADYLINKYGIEFLKVKEKKWGIEPQLNYRHKHDINICIPSLGRAKLLNETTMELIRHLNFPIYIFLTNHMDLIEYKKILGKNINYVLDNKVVGIGNVRTKIRNYFPAGTKIVMIDDDIMDICKANSDYPLNLYRFFNSVFKTMSYEKVKFAGCNPVSNEFFMKEGYTTNLKYTGGHLIFEVIREKEDRIEVKERHFEDYIANIKYFIKDKKLLRWNDIYVKTKYYNPDGGICQQYGGLDKRLEDAEKLAIELEVIYKGFVKSYFKKGSSRCPPCWNLKLNSRALPVPLVNDLKEE